MKHFTLAGLLLGIAMAVPLSAAEPAAADKQIATLEADMNAAYAANDLDKYFGYYADELSAIFYNERTTLADYRKSWTASVKAGNVVTSVKLADMKVRLLPSSDVAVASFRIDVGNRHADGKTTSEQAFETDIWVKRKGVWKVTHVHYALAAPPPG